MYKLLNLLKRYHPLLLFLLLEVMAVSYYAKSTPYSRAKILSASNVVTGGVHGAFSSIGDWFSLGSENRKLLDRLAAVETELSAYKSGDNHAPQYPAANASSQSSSGSLSPQFSDHSPSLSHAADYSDSLAAGDPAGWAQLGKHFYSWARVINNTINRKENFFIIDKGLNYGVERNMSVITADGTVVGYVEEVSHNFSVCMSILNRNFRIGGRVKGKDYIGSIFWQGNRVEEVTISDIPQYADIEVGDTIVSAFSSRFPPDVFIGTVKRPGTMGESGLYQVDVELGTDMARLTNVMLVRYDDSQELQSLEEQYMGSTVNGQNR